MDQVKRIHYPIGQWADVNGDIIGGHTETPSMQVLSAGATIAAGAKSVTIMTDSSFVGTILGETAAADTTYTFNSSFGNFLGAIVITRSAGSFTVLKNIQI